MATFDYLHLFASVGVIVLFLFFVPSPLLSIYRLFLRPAKKLRNYGQWAVITGATDGIGRAYAFQLAKQNLSLFLISRNEQRLGETETDIKKKYPKANIRTFPLDFQSFDTTIQNELTTILSSIDVGVLVNNVGMGYGYPEYYDQLPRQTVETMIDLNVKAVSVLTHMVLPFMLKKRRGCIVNIASFAALVASPLLAQYAASKAYIVNLTSALSYEYAPRGIHFQVQCPLYVTSKLSKIRSPSLLTPSPSTYATAGVKAFGYETVSIPYWPHALENRIAQLLPEMVIARISLWRHQGIRQRALKKKEREVSVGKTQ